MSVYWNYESWGSTEPPKNYESICDAVNEHLEDMALIHGCDEDELDDESERLWEQYCHEDEIFGIESEWKEE